MKSAKDISDFIDSALSNPVRPDSEDFVTLQELQSDAYTVHEHRIKTVISLFYSLFLEGVRQGKAGKPFFKQAIDIITRSGGAQEALREDIKNIARTHETCAEEKKHSTYYIFIIFRMSKSEELLNIAAEAGLTYIKLACLYGNEKFDIKNVLHVMSDKQIIKKQRKRIKRTHARIDKVKDTEIAHYKFMYSLLSNSNDLTRDLLKFLGEVGVLLVFYEAEQFRIYRKLGQELLGEGSEKTLFDTPLKYLRKIPVVRRLFARKRQPRERAPGLSQYDIDVKIENTKHNIDTLLLDRAIKNRLIKKYGINKNAEHFKWIAINDTLNFHRTGSTSIILKYLSNEGVAYALKLVKPRFFYNERIKGTTKDSFKTYEKLGKHKIVHFSDEYYVLMDFIEGQTVSEFIQTSIKNTNWDNYVPTISRVIENILIQIKVLHAINTYHKDLSKDNIIIQPNYQVSFIDFGQNFVINDVAAADQYADIANSLAPEIRSNKKLQEDDYKWADLYSLGVLILEIFSKKNAKDQNDLATMLDSAWERSPGIAYLIELLIDGKMDNRKSICDILNSDYFMLNNIFRHKKDEIGTFQVVPEAALENNQRNEKTLYDFYIENLRRLFSQKIKPPQPEATPAKGEIINAVTDVQEYFKRITTGVFSIAVYFFNVIPDLMSILYYFITHKEDYRRQFINGYFGFFQKLSYFCFMLSWFWGIGFFAKLFIDTFANKPLVASLQDKWVSASSNFLSFVGIEWHPQEALASGRHSYTMDASSILGIDLPDVFQSIYKNYPQLVLQYYTPEHWDTVLSALIVGTTFAMCATSYYRIIFSNITTLDFARTSTAGTNVRDLPFLKRLSNHLSVYFSELLVRTTSFLHVVPIIVGMSNPTYWATCSWLGVLPVTINSWINSNYLIKTFEVYNNKSNFMLPISNAVNETVKKFATWHILLVAYIVVLLVGDFGLRGHIFQDWLMYSFLVGVVNVVKMQHFNCRKEGPGIHATLYRCYAASLRSQHIKHAGA